MRITRWSMRGTMAIDGGRPPAICQLAEIWLGEIIPGVDDTTQRQVCMAWLKYKLQTINKPLQKEEMV